jgi:hypothetical protein
MEVHIMKKGILATLLLLLATGCMGSSLEGKWTLSKGDCSNRSIEFLDNNTFNVVKNNSTNDVYSGMYEEVGENKYKFNFGAASLLYTIHEEDDKLIVTEDNDDKYEYTKAQ